MTAPQAPYSTRPGNGAAVAGLVTGVASLFVLWVVLAPLAIGLGAAGWSRANRGASHKGMGVAAVACGAVAIAVWVLIAGSPGSRLDYFTW